MLDLGSTAAVAAQAQVTVRTVQDWLGVKRRSQNKAGSRGSHGRRKADGERVGTLPKAPELAAACALLEIAPGAILLGNEAPFPLVDQLERHFASIIDRKQPGIPFGIEIDGAKALKLIEARAREIIAEAARIVAVTYDVRTQVHNIDVALLGVKLPTRIKRDVDRYGNDIEATLMHGEGDALNRLTSLFKGFQTHPDLIAVAAPAERDRLRRERANGAPTPPAPAKPAAKRPARSSRPPRGETRPR